MVVSETMVSSMRDKSVIIDICIDEAVALKLLD